MELLPDFNVAGTSTSIATVVLSELKVIDPVPENVSFDVPVTVIAPHSRGVAPRLIVSAEEPVAMATASDAPGIAPPQLAGSPQLEPSPAPDHVAACAVSAAPIADREMTRRPNHRLNM